uniref:Uncharacterized protein n=1 Tax=Chaetoceros debilis TaxID=122233 RepID=A0A7S3QJ34_9STRA|mmetsp:Transcript_20455/g.31041  ORF Transcript_20455/g.31041 Transcript_20455/m.31041 type:complete len:142 (+) Transcript_20455:58-483(+)|eukprot:CAMPEP_0194084624 /NCGR_PEP_ID=MMETSP0149-20130528/14036_1 /TAXON_ID=122233 /ORGANISM="Chaetoceros debilis, Strain MM31A-1" /LENGTH=141 /DNA_ID=CAMNT_0038767323 /DNA_START=1 /DNA_END=426 /DNA_ORIENTATION=-
MFYRRATRSSHYSDDYTSHSESSSNQLFDNTSVQSNTKKLGNHSRTGTGSIRRRLHNDGRYSVNEEQDFVTIAVPELSPKTSRAHRAFWSQLDSDDDDNETTNSLMTNGTCTAKAKNRSTRKNKIFDRMAGICSGGLCMEG